ncbi:MAG: response regulator [Chloroflexi bacterium]|nr:response regulator [Chloroflexota bacterium]
MWSTIKQVFGPPIFEDEDKTRIAGLLGVVLLILFLVAIVRTVLAVRVSQEYWTTVLIANGILVGVSVGVFVLMRAGRVRLACIVLTVYQWLVIAWLVYSHGGIGISVYSFFIFAILVAGLLLGGRWAIGYATISVIYGTLLLHLETQGIVSPSHETSMAAFSTITPSFITTAVLVYLYDRDIVKSLKRARRNAARVARANEQLTREVIAREQVEKQLLHAQKMEAVGRLAGGIAHDFNNLLVPIIGYADLSLADLDPDSKLHTNLVLVRKAAGRATNLTRQILAFSRQQVLKTEVLDLNELIDEFQKMFHRLIGENIEIRTFLAPSPCWVQADKGQIEQVLMNLVINARDAMPAGGELIIETANTLLDEAYAEKYAGELTPGHYALLAVSDTGHGMDAETQKRIFDPFFTTKESSKGTGLGLATTFGIIKQHQGNIQVYSEPGKGTTFKIYLPRAENPLQTTVPETEGPISIYGSETVLVVEDEETVLNLVCKTLEAHGYDVTGVNNPADCLEMASGKASVHLLLTDTIMPGMNGKELYQKLVAIHPNCRVLYMSGYTTNVIVHSGILDEGINFLQKPFTIYQLVRKIRKVLN